ncbi:hypothetical protein Tco_1351588 [Tanacetum coccineum]
METFSSLVAGIKRLLGFSIAIAPRIMTIEIWQMDVKTVFLNGYSLTRFTWSKPEVLSIQKYPKHNPGELHWTTVKNILKYLRLRYAVRFDWMVMLIGRVPRSKIFATSSAEALRNLESLKLARTFPCQVHSITFPSLVYELSATPTPKWELLDCMVVGLALRGLGGVWPIGGTYTCKTLERADGRHLKFPWNESRFIGLLEIRWRNIGA